MLTLLACGSTNCLLDNGPINMPPTVQIAEPSQALHRGETVTFMATVHDPDQSTDSLNVTWYLDASPHCDQAVPMDCASQRKDQCFYTPKALGSICVVVRVEDRYGAKATASSVFLVENWPPIAVIERTSPASAATTLPLLSKLTFSAAKSTDPDDTNLTFTWTVTEPDRTSPSAEICSSPESQTECSFTATIPGKYHVQVIVRDPSGGQCAASTDVVIDEDKPPCIAGTTPRSLQTIAFSDQSAAFVVDSVADDIDPYPESTSGTFTWRYRIGKTGEFQRLPTISNSNRFAVGPAFLAPALGGVIQIRVEYQDSKGHSLSSCDQNADRCELVQGCAQWVTWTVSVL